MIGKINHMRQAWGLPKLRPDHQLARAAEDHSRDMGSNHFFAHNSSNGTDAYSRVMGYTRKKAMGEVLAYVPAHNRMGPRSVLRLWMHSDGHRETLTHPHMRRIGVGRVRGTYNGFKVAFWTVDLTTAH